MFKEPSLNNLDTKTNFTHPDLKPEVLTYVNFLMLEADKLATEINNLKQQIKTNETIKQDTELKKRLTTVLNLIMASRESNEIEIEQVEEEQKEFTSEHVIDLSTPPFIPDGFSLEEHLGEGLFEFNPDNVSLYLIDEQKGGVNGYKLRKELADQPVLNANVLDYLLANPELIPEDWKGKYLCFWGTIYRNSDGDLYVRYLRRRGSEWNWNYRWLANDFNSSNPAALAG